MVVGEARQAPGRKDHLDICDKLDMFIEISGVQNMRVEVGKTGNTISPALTKDITVARWVFVEQYGLCAHDRASFRPLEIHTIILQPTAGLALPDLPAPVLSTQRCY